MTINGLSRKMQAFDVKKSATEIVSDTIGELKGANKKQLFAGYNKNGERLKAYKSPHYAFYKANRNQLPGLGNPDLYDTGALYAGFTFSVTGQQIIEDSTDEKTKTLLKKYGNFFGLGGRYKANYINDTLQPAFMVNVRKQIGL